jgi:hypothetical protein
MGRTRRLALVFSVLLGAAVLLDVAVRVGKDMKIMRLEAARTSHLVHRQSARIYAEHLKVNEIPRARRGENLEGMQSELDAAASTIRWYDEYAELCSHRIRKIRELPWWRPW